MERKLLVTKPQKQALAVATIAALLFGAYFLRHYFTLIVFAAIMAFLFNPIYQKRLKKGRQPGPAAALTFLIALVVILVPLSVILILTGIQVSHIVTSVSRTIHAVDVTNFTQHMIDTGNHFLAKTPITFRLTDEWIRTTAANLIAKAGTFTLNNLRSYAGSFFSFFTTAIIFIFVFLSLLKNQKKITETIRKLNPLGEEIGDLYASRIAAMTKAMVRGQFIIALAQGFTDAALIYLAGFHEAFFFLLLLLTALSFIPLGGGVLAIPIGIIMVLTGNILGGILLVAGHLLIVTNIDNILRPRLVPAEAKLDSALTILSVFAGIGLLGFLGIVVGPVIMIIIVTTISVYLQVYRKVDMDLETSDTAAKPDGQEQTKLAQRLFKRRKKHNA